MLRYIQSRAVPYTIHVRTTWLFLIYYIIKQATLPVGAYNEYLIYFLNWFTLLHKSMFSLENFIFVGSAGNWLLLNMCLKLVYTSLILEHERFW